MNSRENDTASAAPASMIALPVSRANPWLAISGPPKSVRYLANSSASGAAPGALGARPRR